MNMTGTSVVYMHRASEILDASLCFQGLPDYWHAMNDASDK